MNGSGLYDMRDRSQWLALAISLFIAVGTVSMTLLWSRGGRTSARESQPPLFSASGDYSSPQRCRECHEMKYQDWSGASHAGASFGSLFQAYVQMAEEPGECFCCHTTGFDHATGQFALAGVTCEACHGPYRGEHPDKSMATVASKDLCGACHTSTWAEWASSRHGKVGVTCTDCHEVHTQKTRSPDHADAPCIGCHEDQIQDFDHVIHRHSETSVYCIDCHLARPDDDTRAVERNRAATGHSFVVFVSTCSECHDLPLQLDTKFH